MLSADEFERQYAVRSDVTVEQLRVYRTVRPCDCGADNCEGWQSISHARASAYDEEHSSVTPMTRTYWLSFCDMERPAGQRFLGAALVDVPEATARLTRVDVEAQYPHAAPDAEWIAAAMRIAWAAGCNPGGEVLTADITGTPEAASAPRNTLMQLPELIERGLAAPQVQPVGHE